MLVVAVNKFIETVSSKDFNQMQVCFENRSSDNTWHWIISSDLMMTKMTSCLEETGRGRMEQKSNGQEELSLPVFH